MEVSIIVITFAKTIADMETITRTQTVIRFREDILNRARYKAKQQSMSLNAYLEHVVEEAVKPQIPKLPKEFKVSDFVKSLSGVITAPSQEELEADPKLAYILGKGGE